MSHPNSKKRKRNNLIGSLLLVCSIGLLTPSWVSADLIPFILTGAAGQGLLEGNIDPPTGEAGTGGIGSSGIIFNTNTNGLHIHVEWGLANGYTNLSSDVFALHLHGPTASSGDAAFGETTSRVIEVLSNGSSFDASASSGSVNQGFLIDVANGDVQALLDGRTYINLHLASGDGGAIRGYLQQAVPEPGLMIPLLLISGCLISRRRRE
ncbi:MAG: CHRD domain-containing protein [Mariniblastus sp.]|nr:CHRD domain-containing protein [Mariniblastus sp.]